MTDATKTLLKAIKNFNTEGLSELLFDNKSEVACNQRLCAAINKETSNYLARVEYTNKDDSVSRADLVMINRETGKVDLCTEAKQLCVFNILAPLDSEKIYADFHHYFNNLKTAIDKQNYIGSKICIMWTYGWDKFSDQPKMYLREKYFKDRNRKGLKNISKPYNKKEIQQKIKSIFKELDLSSIKSEILYAKDTHEGYKAYLIVTIGKVK